MKQQAYSPSIPVSGYENIVWEDEEIKMGYGP